MTDIEIGRVTKRLHDVWGRERLEVSKIDIRADKWNEILESAKTVKVVEVEKVVENPAKLIDSVKPEQIMIGKWEHNHPLLTKEFVRKYLSEYINQYLIRWYGNILLNWLKQVTFHFTKSPSPTVWGGGLAGSLTVTIPVADLGKLERGLEFLSAETAKSLLTWMQIDNLARQHAINDAFFANGGVGEWAEVDIDGVKYHGLKVRSFGLKLGEG